MVEKKITKFHFFILCVNGIIVEQFCGETKIRCLKDFLRRTVIVIVLMVLRFA